MKDGDLKVGEEVWVQLSGTVNEWNLGLVEEYRLGDLYVVKVKCTGSTRNISRKDIRTKEEHFAAMEADAAVFTKLGEVKK